MVTLEGPAQGRMDTGPESSLTRSWIEIALFSLHGSLLMLRLPHTLRAIVAAMRPNGAGVSDAEFAGFGRIDQRFRPWYAKIAADYARRGRFGFAFDDGLGIPLGPRIYNNWLTYELLKRLGARRMSALGLLGLLLSVGALMASSFGPWSLLVTLLLAGSPLLVLGYTHLGKPEVLWWCLSPLALFLAWSGHFVWSGAIWSLIAFVNLPVAVMTALIAGPALIAAAWPTQLAPLIYGIAPGAAKLALRALYMHRHRFLSSVVSEQARLWKQGWVPNSGELAWMLPYAASVMLAGLAARMELAAGLLAFTGVFLLWANHRVLYMNDAVSFRLALFVTALGTAAGSRSVPALIFAFLLAYNTPMFCCYVTADGMTTSRERVRRRAALAVANFRAFPDLAPRAFTRPIPVMEFFAKLPQGVRFLAEADGDPRTNSKHRHFWSWTDEFLPERRVDLANEIYTRMAEPELADRLLSRFNARQLPPELLDAVASGLGATHIIAFSEETISALSSVGFQRIESLDLGPLEEFRRELDMPKVVFTLLHRPGAPGVVQTADVEELDGSVLKWRAKAGLEYEIRYRYHKQFKAAQGGRELVIEPYLPFPDMPTQFMRVRAVSDDPILLRYKTSIV